MLLQATIDCTDASYMSLAVRYNGDPSGFLYGTNAFPSQSTAGASQVFSLSHYAYAGKACQCALSSAPATEGSDCEDGYVKNVV